MFLLKMEVDVRFFVLALLSMLVKGSENTTKGTNQTSKTLNHCEGCIENNSSRICRKEDNGLVSCLTCRRGYEMLLCDLCSGVRGNNLTGVKRVCTECQCNGSVELMPMENCNLESEACYICQSNSTDWDCKQCVKSYHDKRANRATYEQRCIFMSKDEPVRKKVSGLSTKERIIVAVCSSVGFICLIFIGFLLFRLCRNRNFKGGRPLWTVELTNRNYDDLDFSLLDPITDIPFVYRTDISEFDSDALLGSDKPQLIMEVDEEEAIS